VLDAMCKQPQAWPVILVGVACIMSCRIIDQYKTGCWFVCCCFAPLASLFQALLLPEQGHEQLCARVVLAVFLYDKY